MTIEVTKGRGHVIVRALDFHPKAISLDMVCHNLRHAYLLQVGHKQIPADRETWFIVCHVEIHVDSHPL